MKKGFIVIRHTLHSCQCGNPGCDNFPTCEIEAEGPNREWIGNPIEAHMYETENEALQSMEDHITFDQNENCRYEISPQYKM